MQLVNGNGHECDVELSIARDAIISTYIKILVALFLCGPDFV